MKLVSGVAVFAASLAVGCVAPAAAETPLMIALASANATAERPAPRDFTAQFATDRGDVFSIALDGEHLTLEAPESWNLPATPLRVANARELVALDGSASVTLVDDRSGVARFAALRRSADGLTVHGTRILAHGVVTIEDAGDAIVTHARHGVVTIEDVRAPAQRGVVTIQDVSDGTASGAAAAAE